MQAGGEAISGGFQSGKNFLIPITESCLAQGLPPRHPAPFPASCFRARVPPPPYPTLLEPVDWQAGQWACLSDLNLLGFLYLGLGVVIWVPLSSLLITLFLSAFCTEPRAYLDAQGGLSPS